MGCAWTVQDDEISSPINDMACYRGGASYSSHSLMVHGESSSLRRSPARERHRGPDGRRYQSPGRRGPHHAGSRSAHPTDHVGRGMDIGPDGSIYVNDHGGHKVVKLANGAPGMYGAATIPSEDGSELYEFDERGRHLRTLNGLTNDVVWSLPYDAQAVIESRTPTAIPRPSSATRPVNRRRSDLRAGIVTLGLDERGYWTRSSTPPVPSTDSCIARTGS